jgi:PTS system nitrogen regulatory IIA component
MQIADFLASADALIDFQAPDKKRLLNELSRRAASSQKLDGEQVSQAILKREELGSTGVGAGVAIPHARIANLNSPFGILVRVRKAVDFDAVDGNPVDLVFLLLLPDRAEGEHLSALAAVARRLREPQTLEALRHARDAQSFYRAISQADKDERASQG